MTGLLVSVRSAAEAELALRGGADVIDIKEPDRGALGPADPEVWQEINRIVAGKAIVTAALGELLAPDVIRLAAMTHGLTFVKIGLAGCHHTGGWLARWLDTLNALPAGVQAVPVAYADWPAAAAPSPSVALAMAAASPSKLMLVDTFQKNGGGLLAHLSLESLTELLQTARALQVRVVLAGSLTPSAMRMLLALAPIYLGVRGAACLGGRSGMLQESLVKSLASLVHGAAQKVAG